MKINIKENKKNKTIVVEAYANPDITKKDNIKTHEIEKHLEDKNIKFYECLKEGFVNNRLGFLEGVWIFSSSNPKSKKILDKTTPSVVSSVQVKKTKIDLKPKDE
tara:strand:- start:4946 stop:5260 length:315 start_codon:yes stop_codon:yes gene_type:complete